ncbi:MAG: DUF507 family protein [Candidatus Tectomicrobia bacterium]|nr:DUF507 family protein [Candidatus Tectomicrobia bacterium]
MRLRRKMIEYIAKTVTDHLLEEEMLGLEGSADDLTDQIRRMITEDLSVEDRLNEEVKELLNAHQSEIDRGDVDYSRMFAMVKRQLVRERGLIL